MNLESPVDSKLLETFELVSCRHRVTYDELTSDEHKLVKICFDRVLGDSYGEMTVEEYMDDPNDELYIDVWDWRGNTLVDIYFWPGDNQAGIVFCNDKIAIRNNDISLTFEGSKSKLFDRLESSMDAFYHLRGNFTFGGGCKDHKHCEKAQAVYDAAESDRLKRLGPVNKHTMDLIQDDHRVSAVLTSANVCSLVFGFLDTDPSAVCASVCKSWEQKGTKPLRQSYFFRNIGLLRWAHSRGLPCRRSELFGKASRDDQFSIMKWAHNTKHKIWIGDAQRWGYLEVLEWDWRDYREYSNDVRWWSAAQRYGHTHILKFVAKKLGYAPFKVTEEDMADDSSTCAQTAYNRRYEAMWWMHSMGYIWGCTASYITANGDFDVLKKVHADGASLDTGVCASAAKAGRLDILAWARANGASWEVDPKYPRTCRYAAEFGHLRVLIWAQAHHAPWDEETCLVAAENNNFKILKWARKNGCDWSKGVCTSAARNGNLEMLEWARNNGCLWDEKDCIVDAAAGGHLDVLKYICTTTTAWREELCKSAAQHEQLKVLRWTHERGGRWDSCDGCRYATCQGHVVLRGELAHRLDQLEKENAELKALRL